MSLSGHLAVWFSAVALIGLASPLVRAYATHLERRARARTDHVLARMLGPQAAAESDGHENVTSSRTT